MKKLFRDINIEVKFRKVIKNVATLVSGNGIGMLIGVAVSALSLKAIGVEQFGQAILIMAYVEVIDAIFNFQSWQAFIKFGAASITNKEKTAGYLKSAFVVDFSTSLLGVVVGWILVDPICGKFLGWNADICELTKLYTITILFHLEGMAVGYLRVIDKFKMIALSTIVSSSIKLALLIVAFYSGPSISKVLFSYAIGDVCSYILILLVALFNIRKFVGKLNWRDTGWMCGFKSFFSFSAFTSLASTLDIPIKQLDSFIIASVLSVDMVAVQKIFTAFLNVLNKIANPISQVVYPQLTVQIDHGNVKESIKDVNKIKKVIFVIGIPIALFMGLSSPIWLKLIYGEMVASYWHIFIIEAVFRIFSLMYIGIHPLFIAMGYVKENIPILLVSNVVYFGLSILLGRYWGLYGIAFAFLVQLLMVIEPKKILIQKGLRESLEREKNI